MRFLSKTKIESLFVLVVGLCIAMLSLVISALASGDSFRISFALFVFAPLTVGLWLQLNFARAFLAAVLLFASVVMPFGFINPFAVGDYFPASPPDVWDLALDVFPWSVIGLIAVHVLGKYKSEFRPIFKPKEKA